jgi:hypothetical protein
LARLVPRADRGVGDRGDGWVFFIKVELAGGGFLEQLATPVAKKLVQTDLDFEGMVGILLVKVLLVIFNKRDFLVGGFGGEDVAERNILETKVLSNVIVVGNVDARRDTVYG